MVLTPEHASHFSGRTCCLRSDTRCPPFAGLRQPRRNHSLLNLEGAFATPGTPSRANGRAVRTGLPPPGNGMHTNPDIRLNLLQIRAMLVETGPSMGIG